MGSMRSKSESEVLSLTRFPSGFVVSDLWVAVVCCRFVDPRVPGRFYSVVGGFSGSEGACGLLWANFLIYDAALVSLWYHCCGCWG